MIGFSTGCMHGTMPLEDTIKLYHKIGADAVEISKSLKDMREKGPNRPLILEGNFMHEKENGILKELKYVRTLLGE
jgi:hypothetical protein